MKETDNFDFKRFYNGTLILMGGYYSFLSFYFCFESPISMVGALTTSVTNKNGNYYPYPHPYKKHSTFIEPIVKHCSKIYKIFSLTQFFLQ